MVLGIQIAGFLFGLFMIYYSFLNYKRKEFTAKEFSFWLVLWVLFIIIAMLHFVLAPIAKAFSFFRTWDLLDLISFFSLTSLIIAITSAISVVFPRLITNKNKGLVSWVDISNYESSNDYLSDLLKKNEEEIMKEHYSVNYFLSLVCKKKYYWMSLSFIAMIIGMMLGIIVFVNI